MRRKILPLILGGALSVAAVAPAAANSHQTQVGGAGGLVAAVVQAQVRDVDVFVLNNSLNNLLRNADIDVLNNSPILSNNDIEILEDGIQILENGNIVVSVLSGGVAIGPITLVPAGA